MYINVIDVTTAIILHHQPYVTFDTRVCHGGDFLKKMAVLLCFLFCGTCFPAALAQFSRSGFIEEDDGSDYRSSRVNYVGVS